MTRNKPGPKMKPKTIEKILSRTRQESECRIWLGAMHVQGYGMTRHKGKMRTVHSVVAELKYKIEAPGRYSGKRVTRTCGNIACVNPDHITIVRAGSINEGKNYVRGRFSADEIRAIRKEYDSYKVKYGMVKYLAEKYNCSVPLMSSITRRQIYKRVKDET
jgi:hypothetical protein